MSNTTPSECDHAEAESKILKSYWKSNLLFMGILLFFWAAVSLGAGILFADTLNEYHLFGTGYPLGFWFAQQGSIISFVLIILIYALGMNRLDRLHHVQRAQIKGKETEDAETFSGEGI